jgi:hypothetical protein
MQLECPCPVCRCACRPYDVVDFNKSCEEQKGGFLNLSGIPIYYFLCGDCGFCFAPEISAWSIEDFEKNIYNDAYKEVDPDYLMRRPRANYESLLSTFGNAPEKINHLDFGGGDGLLSKLLCESGWKSMSYDPFVNKDVKTEDLGTFNFITAFEVFEHVPDVGALMFLLRSLLAPDGIVLFTTLISDGQIVKHKRLTWWYAAPRNGHISLFSRSSLALLASKNDLKYGGVNNLIHFLWTSVPGWAQHILRVPN